MEGLLKTVLTLAARNTCSRRDAVPWHWATAWSCTWSASPSVLLHTDKEPLGVRLQPEDVQLQGTETIHGSETASDHKALP